jgi:uncharacterized protein YhaN
MTSEQFSKITEYDRRCGEHLMMLIPVFQDRRDLLQYVKELTAEIATLKERQEAFSEISTEESDSL